MEPDPSSLGVQQPLHKRGSLRVVTLGLEEPAAPVAAGDAIPHAVRVCVTSVCDSLCAI